jgi:hypothetical protein
MLLAITTVKLIAEIAGLALLGQWLVGLLAGANRERNFFYQLLAVIGRPFVMGARWITPKIVLERHLPLVAFLVLLVVWMVTVDLKVQHCLEIGVHLCK